MLLYVVSVNDALLFVCCHILANVFTFLHGVSKFVRNESQLIYCTEQCHDLYIKMKQTELGTAVFLLNSYLTVH